jgi:hypothetical protein
MKTLLKVLLLVSSFTVLSSIAHADCPASLPSGTREFISGSGATYAHLCITENGNVGLFESPQGIQNIGLDQLPAYEGYGFCDYVNLPHGVPYNDYLRDSHGSLGDSIVRQPHGSGTFPLIITRKSSDGVWTLTQTFSLDTKYLPILTIKMLLRNNSDTARYANFLRTGEVIVDAPQGNPRSWFEYTNNSVLAFPVIPLAGSPGIEIVPGTYGFMVQTPSSKPITHRLGFTPPDPCNPFAHTYLPRFADDFEVISAFSQNVPAHSSISMIVVYQTI